MSVEAVDTETHYGKPTILRLHGHNPGIFGL